LEKTKRCPECDNGALMEIDIPSGNWECTNCGYIEDKLGKDLSKVLQKGVKVRKSIDNCLK